MKLTNSILSFFESQVKYPHLVRLIKENNEAKKLWRKLLSLPLLPPEDIRLEFQRIKLEALNMSSHWKQFLKYFEKQWIGGRFETPEKISVFNRVHRTQNALEAFNGVLKTKIQAHNNFYKFVDALQEIEKRKCVVVDLLTESGGATAPKPSKENDVSNLIY